MRNGQLRAGINLSQAITITLGASFQSERVYLMKDNNAPEKKKKIKLTSVSLWHFFRLGYRSVLFIVLAIIYIDFRLDFRNYPILHDGASLLTDLSQSTRLRMFVLGVVWVVFMIEMAQRLFPSRIESPGSQKQFARNYKRTGKTEIVIPDNNGAMLVALLWVCFNAGFGAFYMAGILDAGIMVLLSCAFSVCDVICILFFCPFQTWFLKNKCCSSCRIYNWDYAMMFTPLFFVRSPYTWSLLFMSLIILFRWEITFYRYPERFSENTNAYLACANCTEKLCAHKTQLHKLWKDVNAFTAERRNRLRGEENR